MAYIGRDVNYGNATADHFVGSGGATYALTYDTSTNGVVVSLDGVVQKNGTDFNITGTSLVFTSVVASPIAIQVIYTGITLGIGTPADGTVTDVKITAMAASKLTGTIADARFPATLPAISGASLTNLPSDITKSTSEPTATINPSGGVGTVWLRTTAGEMYCCTDATTNANVWTNIGDGTGTKPFAGMVGTGGTITTDGDFKIHTFTTSGTFSFEVTTLGQLALIEYLVIAGGGGGGSENYSSGTGGGGGAGGYKTDTSFSVSASVYTVTVGAGGAGTGVSANSSGVNGTNSVFSTITSTGGGAGGNTTGSSGGSGGGGGNSTGGAASPAGQGNAGGAYTTGFSGGGGGAGGAGNDGSVTSPGSHGGIGLASSISGSSVYRGGGGGGGTGGSVVTNAPGGLGGGGQGGDYTPPSGATQSGTVGTANTGGGGGGGTNSGGAGAAGGSGVVIIRYQFQ